MADELDSSNDAADGESESSSFLSQFPAWLKILAGVLTGAAALAAALPPLVTALRGTTPANAATKPSADARYIVVQTNDHFLALRGLPTASSELIIKMPQGSVVTCGPPLDDHPSWRTCGFAGRNGYANTLYLKKLEG